MKYIPYGQQAISSDDIQEVCKVLSSDWLTQGPTISSFEEAVAHYVHAHHAVAVNSATSALHIACLALGLGPGDYLWTSPNTFVASSNCALYCGAKVDFVDIDLKTYNMSVNALEAKLISAKKNGTLPKIVVPVHFSGQSCDMEKIKKLSEKYDFKIIEDASHAIGGSYKNQKIGSCTYSDLTVFSFHPVKIMTTGEGGMVLTNNAFLYQTLLRLRTHGITRDLSYMETETEGPWYYQQIDLGFNYRITDIQAALGLSQLRKVDQFVAERKRLVDKYNKRLAHLPIQLPSQHADCDSAWHLYVVLINREKTNKSRLQIFTHMREANIGVNVHYIPVHTQPYYKKLGLNFSKLENAEDYYQRTISLPLYPTMDNTDQERVINTFEAAFA